MSYKWIGAVLIIGGCGGSGFLMAAGYRHQERLLRQLIRALRYMQWELQYRLTPLPELCRQAGRGCGGALGALLRDLARELDRQRAPDAYSCMAAALGRSRELTGDVQKRLLQLGRCLGRYDLQGQLQGLEAVQRGCEEAIAALGRDREARLRSYQTLGLCAGAALAILFA